jgi:exodeoxyribonuclease VII large subunit
VEILPEDGLEAGRAILTVSELTAALKDLVEAEFAGFWLEGEISNLKLYPSGHTYFTLKDEDSQISAVMWKGISSRLKFEPHDGDHVIARGKLSIYEKRGNYQVVVEAMEPKGLGALQAAFEQLKKKLNAEGLFEQIRKKTIPSIPWTIGIVTSSAGAVIRDMVRTIKRRFPRVRIIFCPVAVQGAGAAQQVAQAIGDLNEHGKADVIIVGRGGGSLEDLWAFNEEVVARAIFESKIPVVSAVGHETDFTIADFVADARASTPTAAAEMVTPELGELYARIAELSKRLKMEFEDLINSKSQRLDDLYERLERSVRNLVSARKSIFYAAFRHLGALSPEKRLAAWKDRLKSLDTRLVLGLSHARDIHKQRVSSIITHFGALSPGDKIASNKDRLKSLDTRLVLGLRRSREIHTRRVLAVVGRFGVLKPAGWTTSRQEKLRRDITRAHDLTMHTVKEKRSRFHIAAGRLDALSPLKSLGRGYSIVTSPDGGRIYKSVADLAPGSRIRIRLSDGEAGAVVEGGKDGRQKSLF